MTSATPGSASASGVSGVDAGGGSIGGGTVPPWVTVTRTLGALFVPPGPVTDRAKVYLRALLPASIGAAVTTTDPLEQPTEEGSPLTAGFEENVQLVALATVADSLTVRPDATDVGVAEKDEIDGFTALADAVAFVATNVTPRTVTSVNRKGMQRRTVFIALGTTVP